MKIAIMQPYFFPYPGYYELMSEVDLFVYFTDVQYIRRGWVNRNCIRSNTDWQYITVPVTKHHQTDNIKDIYIAHEWADKHISTFKHSYKDVDLTLLKFYKSLSWWDQLLPMLTYSLEWMSSYLGFGLKVADSADYPSELKGEDRIIDLCKKLGATTYVNLAGGKKLYSKDHFSSEGINLEFMPLTTQGNLSILDNCFNENNFRLKTRAQ